MVGLRHSYRLGAAPCDCETLSRARVHTNRAVMSAADSGLRVPSSCVTLRSLRIVRLSWIVEKPMTALNAVRFRVKPGREQEFLDAHKKVAADWPGLVHANIIKTGDRSFCIIAEWKDMDACVNARPNMIATLNSFRDTLEDLGGGLGVTDPAAGPVVLALK